MGDFDTAPCPEQQDDDIVVLPHVKDDTDTEYAAKLVSQKGFTEVLLLGALGGKRLEHTLANLCTGLGLEQRGVRVTIQDERSRVSYVLPGETRSYPKEDYFFFSVFPLEGKAEGVCESGSFYELTDAILTATYPLGVSNEYAEGSDCITVSTRTGALVVVETLADGPGLLKRLHILCANRLYWGKTSERRGAIHAGGCGKKPETSPGAAVPVVRH